MMLDMIRMSAFEVCMASGLVCVIDFRLLSLCRCIGPMLVFLFSVNLFLFVHTKLSCTYLELSLLCNILDLRLSNRPGFSNPKVRNEAHASATIDTPARQSFVPSRHRQ